MKRLIVVVLYTVVSLGNTSADRYRAGEDQILALSERRENQLPSLYQLSKQGKVMQVQWVVIVN